MTRLALIDIDGVLANDSHRTPHAILREWAEYFDPERMLADTVWPEGRALVQRLWLRRTEIAYLTGRREDRRDVTERWLINNRFPYGQLYMRHPDMKMRLAELKASIIRDIKQATPTLDIVLYDDDPEVIRTVREEFGDDTAVHCTWYVKPDELIRRASA
jgi:hypothetical protein